jgi:Flp pilus assembly protein TadG
MKTHINPPSRQRGAAMVEFIVGAVFVLVPMYLGVQALGKFADVQHTANAAARYAAWEKTVWFEDTTSRFQTHNAPNQKSAAQIRDEIMVRVVNDKRAGLKYADADKSATTFTNGIDPMWQDAAGVDYLKDAPNLKLASSWESPSKDLLGGAISLLNAIPLPASFVGTVAPPVPTNTLAVSTFKLDKIGENSGSYKRLWSKAQGLPDDWLGLDFEGRSAILSNSWVANASGGTHEMVSDSVPTARGLGAALEVAIKSTMVAWDATLFPRVDIGKVAPDVVPDDRLK